MRSGLRKIKTYTKAKDYTPPNAAIKVRTNYGTLKSERVLKTTYQKGIHCCFPTSLRLFREERLNKYV